MTTPSDHPSSLGDPQSTPAEASVPTASAASSASVAVSDSNTPAPQLVAAAPPAEEVTAFPFALSRRDVLFLLVTGAIIIVLSSIHWVRISGWGAYEIEVDRLPQHRLDYKIDVNDATWVEWMQLEGIGDQLARRIVADRDEHGPFRSVNDITRVKGIGPKTLGKIREHLECNKEATIPSE